MSNKSKRYSQSRRKFLKDSAATVGVVAGAGQFLFGCAASDAAKEAAGTPDAESGPRRFTKAGHHFDLSHVNSDLFLDHHMLVGANSYALKEHDETSRTAAREQNDYLATVPDHKLTHYAHEVEFPEDAPQMYHVRSTHPDHELPSVTLMAVHIPQSGIDTAKEIHGDRFSFGRAHVDYYAADNSKADDANDKAQTSFKPFEVNKHAGPFDSAKTLIFSHPGLISLDATTAALIFSNIDQTPNLQHLALEIFGKNKAVYDPDSLAEGWAYAEWSLDLDGNKMPKLDIHGNPIKNDKGEIEYEWSMAYHPDVLAAAQPVIEEVMALVNDDPALLGKKYTIQDGTASVATESTVNDTADGASKPDADEPLSYSFPENNIWQSGQRVSILEQTQASGLPGLKIKVENAYMRYLGINIAYYDENDKLITGDSLENLIKETREGGSQFDTEDAQYVEMIAPPATWLGVPLNATDAFDSPSQTFNAALPVSVRSIAVLTSSLAFAPHKGPHFEHVGKPAVIMTYVFSYGFPMLLLGAGISGMMGNKIVNDLRAEVGLAVIQAASSYAMSKLYTSKGMVGSVGLAIVEMCIKKIIGRAAVYIAAKMTEAAAESIADACVPFVGTVVRVLSAAANIAKISQTSIDLSRAQRVVINKITFTHDVTVNITHDDNNTGFPATAKTMEVTLQVGSKTISTNPAKVELKEPSKMTTQTVTFKGVPRGGIVTANVTIRTDTGWAVATGVRSAVNVGQHFEAETTDNVTINLTLNEHLVPLDANTTYSHKQKVAKNNGVREWQEGAAPTVTVGALSDCGNTDKLAVCKPISVTFSTSEGQVGYAWQGLKDGLIDCNTDTAGFALYQAQNLNYAGTIDQGKPDATLHTLKSKTEKTCGYREPVHVAYALVSKWVEPVTADQSSVAGKHFVVAPDENDVQHVHELPSLSDPQKPWDLQDAESWGQFSFKNIRAIALNDRLGYLAAIPDNADKIEILKLDPMLVGKTNDAVKAIIHGKSGKQKGNMIRPVAIAAVPTKTAFLVLEQGNARVQAFDVHGNPNNTFFKGQSSYFALKKESGKKYTYLDISVEFSGYIYVLSYTDDGDKTSDYRVDIYKPNGDWLAQTQDISAAKLVVDYWRNVYTLNYETIGDSEPSVSQWIPSTPKQ